MKTRGEYLSSVQTLVIKLGTQLLSDKDGRLDADFISAIASQVAALIKRGVRVTIVSSGAIGCGVRGLSLDKRPTDLAKLQAVAAVGQRRLMDVWADAFAPHNVHVAQLLLTREDIEDRTRFLNLSNTIVAAQEYGAVPIINENDTVSTDELVKITFGDNDILAAMIAHAIRADLLVLLTVVDGLLNGEGNSVRCVESIERARKLVRVEKSALGKGGMDSKLQAAKMITDAGELMVVADGWMPDILSRMLAGEEVGTLFAPASKKKSSRSRWIGAVRPVGTIVIDEGASRAVLKQNRSLLPAGILEIRGDFLRGDIVAIESAGGAIIARGLSNYASSALQLIRGKKTREIKQILAEAAYDEAVHRDNLVLESIA